MEINNECQTKMITTNLNKPTLTSQETVVDQHTSNESEQASSNDCIYNIVSHQHKCQKPKIKPKVCYVFKEWNIRQRDVESADKYIVVSDNNNNTSSLNNTVAVKSKQDFRDVGFKVKTKMSRLGGYLNHFQGDVFFHEKEGINLDLKGIYIKCYF
jgi:hypothetical protein